MKWSAGQITRALAITMLIFLPDLIFFLRNDSYNHIITGSLIVTTLLLLPIVLFANHLRIYYAILAFVATVGVVALVPVLLINSMVNTEMMGLLLNTNYHEVTELLGSNIIVLLALMVLMFWVSIRISKRLPAKIGYRRGLFVSLFATAAFLCIPVLLTVNLGSEALVKYKPILRNAFRSYFPFRLGNAASFLNTEWSSVAQYKQTVAHFSFGAKLTDSTAGRKVHVLVIGETARADHWSVNGYHRNTSPLLGSQTNLVSFSNVASGASHTINAIPLIITRADADRFRLHTQERSVLAAFKECGYKTFWISNQSKYGLASSVSMHYADADTLIFNGWGSNDNSYQGTYDGVLLPAVKNVLAANAGSNLFIVVHMIGSHWRYGLRYPLAFEKFLPVSGKSQKLAGHPPKEEMINEYDNSILYSDFILNTIIEEIKATGAEATLTYVSDHGENLGDTRRELFFHGIVPTRKTTHVPLFVWYSDAYARNYSQTIQMLSQNKNLPVSSAANVFPTLLSLGRIEVMQADSNLSITNARFRGDKQRVMSENGRVLNFHDLE